MDKTKFSKRRLIENELVLRRKNETAKAAIQKYYGDAVDTDDELLEFFCECSNDDCEARVKLTITEYDKIHQRNDHFVVIKGHETDAVEKIVKRSVDYVVVEKFALPA